MVAKLYPSGHRELNEVCPDCKGEGYIEKTDKNSYTSQVQNIAEEAPPSLKRVKKQFYNVKKLLAWTV